jgi:hypothetical protein
MDQEADSVAAESASLIGGDYSGLASSSGRNQRLINSSIEADRAASNSGNNGGRSRGIGTRVRGSFMNFCSLDRDGCVGLLAVCHLFHFRWEPVKRANKQSGRQSRRSYWTSLVVLLEASEASSEPRSLH